MVTTLMDTKRMDEVKPEVKPFSLAKTFYIRETDSEFRGCAISKLVYDELGEEGIKEFTFRANDSGDLTRWVSDRLNISYGWVLGLEYGFEEFRWSRTAGYRYPIKYKAGYEEGRRLSKEAGFQDKR